MQAINRTLTDNRLDRCARRYTQRVARQFFTLLAVACAVATPGAFATTVERLDFERLAQMAELVFEGQVVSSKSYWNAAGTRIHTRITFRVEDVVKGSYSGETLELRFAGGAVGQARMVVEGQRYPGLGEHGIYFVETLSRQLVNPLVGWSQGHYQVDQSNGADNATMRLADGRPLLDFRATPADKTGSLQDTASPEFSDGQAGGLVAGHAAQQGMSRQKFKQRIREITGNSDKAD